MFEILCNIEILCFINLDKIKAFQKIILNKLKEYEELQKFINYLKKYLFNLNPVIYNYTNIINHFKKNNGNIFLDKLCTTNNICKF